MPFVRKLSSYEYFLLKKAPYSSVMVFAISMNMSASHFICLLFLAHVILWPKVLAAINRSTDLNCNLHDFCKWTNGISGIEDDVDWKITDRVVTDFITSVPRGPLGSDDTFAYIGHSTLPFLGKRLDRQYETALLISDVITCQYSAGHLELFVWKSAIGGQLDVCVRFPPKPSSRYLCLNALEGLTGLGWRKVSVRVPPITVPFQLVLRGRLRTSADILAVDQIEYSNDHVCNENSSKLSFASGRTFPDIHLKPRLQNQPKSFGATIPPTVISSLFDPDSRFSSFPKIDNSSSKFETDCTQAECDFERDYCDFDTIRGLQAPSSGLRRHCGPIARYPRLPGSTRGNCSLAMITEKDTTAAAVLSSRSYFLYEPCRLQFSYLLPSLDKFTKNGSSTRISDIKELGGLSVCIDQMEECVWNSFDEKQPLSKEGSGINEEKWRQKIIYLAPGKRQVFFIFEQFRRGMYMALDDVRLRKIDDGKDEIAKCALYD